MNSLQHIRSAVILAVSLVGQSLSQPNPDAIFRLLNLSMPRLERVRESVEQGRNADARIALLDYCRTRDNRTLDPAPYLPSADPARAQENARNSITIKTYREDFGARIDFTRTREDREWNFSLNRMEWLLNYAAVYEKTRDETVVHAWMRQIEQWLEMGDPGYPRTIDTGRRMENWLISYWVIVRQLRSPSVTPEFNARFLASMAEQAEFIYQPEHWRKYSNWGTFESSGMALFVLMFPEYRHSDEWVKEIFFRMRAQLSLSFTPDGMHVEASPSYHLHELQVWHEFLALAERNGIDEPWRPQGNLPSFRELIVPKARAIMHLLKPTGDLPQVGDTDASDTVRALAAMGEYWNDPQLVYAATAGSRGLPPSQRCQTFPEGGYTILRSGWGNAARAADQELYLLMDHGSNKPWHGHRDQFNVIISAYGHDLIVDPGRFTYNENADRQRYVGTAYHNTVTVDGRDQEKTADGVRISLVEFEHGASARGSHTAYPGVRHERSILFAANEYWIVIDRLESAQPHRYAQAWHLSEDAMNRVRIDRDQRTATAPGMRIVIAAEATIEQTAGTVSRIYRTERPAPVISAVFDQAAQAVIPTVLFPRDQRLPVEFPAVRRLTDASDAAGSVRLLVEGESFMDYFVDDPSLHESRPTDAVATDGRTAFVRSDRSGTLRHALVVEGSFLRWKGMEVVAFDGGKVNFELHDGTLTVQSGCRPSPRTNGAMIRRLQWTDEKNR